MTRVRRTSSIARIRRRRTRRDRALDEATSARTAPTVFSPPSAPRLDDDKPLPPPPPRTFWQRLFGGSPETVQSALPAPALDPVRRVLAVPRGPARLEAFQACLAELAPDAPSHRGVALAFHRELTQLGERTGVDLALLEPRVAACAAALEAAGEPERAGALWALLGAHDRAAQLYVDAGAVEQLEVAAFDQELRGTNRHATAKQVFDRYEQLFRAGQRREALRSLTRAVALWPDHPVYADLEASLAARRCRHGLRLEANPSIAVSFRFPVVLGRAADALIRVDSPLWSRQQLALVDVEGAFFLRPLTADAGLLDGTPIARDAVLTVGHHILHCRGIDFDVDVDAHTVWIRGSFPRPLALVASRMPRLELALGDHSLTLLQDADGIVTTAPVLVNNVVAGPDLWLLADDVVMVGDRKARVTPLYDVAVTPLRPDDTR